MAKRKVTTAVLRRALHRAIDLASSAADVIDDANIVDPEDGESEDFRYQLRKLKKLVTARTVPNGDVGWP